MQENQARLRQLATKLTLTDARERREIAVRLHDEIIQEFAFIKLRVAQFRGDAVFCGFERNLEEILALLDGAIQDTRRLTFEISAPILYELGLAAALEWLGEQYQKRHKLRVRVQQQALPAQLSEAVRVTLFQCVQELLTNAVKYAACRTVHIACRPRGQFHPDHGSRRRHGIRRRAGAWRRARRAASAFSASVNGCATSAAA